MCSNWILLGLALGFTLTQGAEVVLEQVTDPLYHVEGPHWDADNEYLYYVDIVGGYVARVNTETRERTKVHIEGGDISPVLTVQNSKDQFVVGRGRDLITFRWDGIDGSDPEGITVLASIDQDRPGNKFNDGKADSQGRIWIGTMETDGDSNRASFFLFSDVDGFEPHKKLNATISNGLAWNNEDTILYYIDSPTQKVDKFDFNSETGEITNRRTVFNLPENDIPGVPDGMTIDNDGNLWVAVWGGSRVLHVNTTDGQLIHQFELPATQVSSCSFGGKNLDELYITTSREGLPDDQQPLAGAVFVLKNTGAKGQSKNNKVKLK